MDATVPELLGCLDAAVQEHLGPFMAHLGARHSIGLSNFDGRRGPDSLSARSHKEVTSFFWWVNRFSLKGCTLDLCYGDREFLVEPLLYYKGVKGSFHPELLLAAAQVPHEKAVNASTFVMSLDHMSRVVAEQAALLMNHWPLLSAPGPEVIDRYHIQLGQERVFNLEAQRLSTRRRAIIEAAAAFHAGEFAQAVRLLRPYAGDADLPRSTVRLLKMAEAKRVPSAGAGGRRAR